jgi:hypothetical protein
VDGANPTITHGFGLSIVRQSEGIYIGTIDPELKPQAWCVFASLVENDPANLHSVRVELMDERAGTFAIRHATTGVTAEDMVDQICVLVVGAIA